MVMRRHVLTLASLLLCTLVLFHFQNCAPSGKFPVSDTAGGGVRIIDDLDKAQLQFVNPDIGVQGAVLTTEITGLCNRDHSGARLRWAVWAGEESPLPVMTGDSYCHNGQFNFEVGDMEQMVCGVKHAIVAAGDWGSSTMATITRLCPPLASYALAAPQGSPFGTSCALEYNPGNESLSICTKVCYRDGKVVSSVAEEVSSCNALASGIVGL